MRPEVRKKAVSDNISVFKPKQEIKPKASEPDLFDNFDDILDSAVVTKQLENIVDISEEKRFLGLKSEITRSATLRRSTVLNSDSQNSNGVIYSFRQLQEYKQNNRQEFERAKEMIYMRAMMAQDADGCGGRNEMANSGSNVLGGNSILNFTEARMNKLTGKVNEHNHKSGEHEHCQHGNDYDGSCAYGCKKAA